MHGGPADLLHGGLGEVEHYTTCLERELRAAHPVDYDAILFAIQARAACAKLTTLLQAIEQGIQSRNLTATLLARRTT